MRRRIVVPADVSGSALAELKDWLGISRPKDDEMLIALLHSCLSMCEAFTGQTPLRQQVEERIPAKNGRYALTSRPIISVMGAELIGPDASQQPLPSDQFEIELQADGSAYVRLHGPVEGQAVAFALQVGIADSWANVPSAIRQGLIRLAAHLYRDRDRLLGAKNHTFPPASVTALWRPWRQVRLR